MNPRWGLLAVAAAALVAYANTAFNEFVYDDDLTVLECPLITSWRNLGDLFSERYFTQTIEMSWRPVSTATMFIDHWLFGVRPGGYHLMNALWHAGAAASLWGLLRVVVGGSVGPLLGGLLFALHPLCSEAVNGISYREDLVVGVFATLAVALSVHLIRGGGGAAIPLVGLGVLLACLAKESGIVIPALIALWWWLAPEERRWRPQGALALALTLAVALGLWGTLRFGVIVYGQAVSPPVWGESRLDALWNFPRVFFHGLSLSLWPLSLSADYEWKALPAFHGLWVWIGWLAVALWCVAAAACRRVAPALGLGLGWYLLALGPVSNIMPLYNPVAERYYYIPFMGLCLAAGWGGRRFAEAPVPWRTAPRRAAVAGVAVIGAALLMVTVNRNLVWGDAESLWESTLEAEPNSTTALNNLGAIRIVQGRYEEGRDLLVRGLDVNPTDADLVFNCGVAQLHLGQWDEARSALTWSVRHRPNAARVHYWFARYHIEAPDGDADLARQALDEAIRLGFLLSEKDERSMREQIAPQEAQ